MKTTIHLTKGENVVVMFEADGNIAAENMTKDDLIKLLTEGGFKQ